MQIGVFLGVEFSFLEDMIYTEDSGQNLRNTLENWLQSQIFEITIRRLVEAIEHAGGGNNPILAATIKANLTGQLYYIDEITVSSGRSLPLERPLVFLPHPLLTFLKLVL